MRPRSKQPVVKLILDDLSSGPATAYDLAAAVKINIRNMRPYIKLLHEQQQIHIVGWERRVPGPAVAVWAAGRGRDRPRPAPLYKR